MSALFSASFTASVFVASVDAYPVSAITGNTVRTAKTNTRAIVLIFFKPFLISFPPKYTIFI